MGCVALVRWQFPTVSAEQLAQLRASVPVSDLCQAVGKAIGGAARVLCCAFDLPRLIFMCPPLSAHGWNGGYFWHLTPGCTDLACAGGAQQPADLQLRREGFPRAHQRLRYRGGAGIEMEATRSVAACRREASTRMASADRRLVHPTPSLPRSVARM